MCVSVLEEEEGILEGFSSKYELFCASVVELGVFFPIENVLFFVSLNNILLL